MHVLTNRVVQLHLAVSQRVVQRQAFHLSVVFCLFISYVLLNFRLDLV